MDSLSQIEKFARENSVPILFAETRDFICGFIRERRAKSILEIGSAIGYSAIQFALASPDVRVVSLEIDSERFSLAQENARDFGLLQRIELHLCDALEFSTDEKFDLIFIDAAKAQYENFFNRFKDSLDFGGAIISDNLLFHGMVRNENLTRSCSTKKMVRKIRKYRSFLKLHPEFTTRFFSAGDGIAVTERNPNFRPLDFKRLNSAAGPEAGFALQSLGLEKSELEKFLSYGHEYYAAHFAGGAGIISFFRKKGSLVLTGIFVAPPARGLGFSKSLLWLAVKAARESGLRKILIPSQWGGMKSFFENFGFEFLSKEKTFGLRI